MQGALAFHKTKLYQGGRVDHSPEGPLMGLLPAHAGRRDSLDT
jgi:hypothetical protein